MSEIVSCPIWGNTVDLTKGQIGDGAELFSMRVGGFYRISGSAVTVIGSLTIEQKVIVTTWLVDQRRAGVRSPIINSMVLEEILEVGRPTRFSEQRDRFFRYLLAKNYRPGSSFQVDRDAANLALPFHAAELTAWVGLEGFGETLTFLRVLAAENYFDATQFSQGRWILLTEKGFEKLEELEGTGPNNRQAFVAMWFDKTMDEVWRDGIAPGIRDAGYEPFRIDGKEHNGKIDDEIVAEIKKSRFLVADFTSGVVQTEDESHVIHRGGVYYEAGLAQGLPIPVIFSVRKDQINKVHFDTRQFAHIVWDDPADFRTKLYNRIAATLKEAPGAPGRGKS